MSGILLAKGTVLVISSAQLVCVSSAEGIVSSQVMLLEVANEIQSRAPRHCHLLISSAICMLTLHTTLATSYLSLV